MLMSWLFLGNERPVGADESYKARSRNKGMCGQQFLVTATAREAMSPETSLHS